MYAVQAPDKRASTVSALTEAPQSVKSLPSECKGNVKRAARLLRRPAGHAVRLGPLCQALADGAKMTIADPVNNPMVRVIVHMRSGRDFVGVVVDYSMYRSTADNGGNVVLQLYGLRESMPSPDAVYLAVNDIEAITIPEANRYLG